MLFNPHSKGFRGFHLQEKKRGLSLPWCPRPWRVPCRKGHPKRGIPVGWAQDPHPGGDTGDGGGDAGWDTPLKRPLRLAQRGPAGRDPPPPPDSHHLPRVRGFWRAAEPEQRPGELHTGMGGAPGGRFGRLPRELSGPPAPSTPREEEEDVTQRFRGGATIFWLMFYFLSF